MSVWIFARRSGLPRLTNRAKKGKISRAINALNRPRQLHIIRFRVWRKLIHYAPRPLSKKASLFGGTRCATMFLRKVPRTDSRKLISRKLTKIKIQPGVAQLVARVVWDHQAAGSNPVTRTISSIHKGFDFMNTRFFSRTPRTEIFSHYAHSAILFAVRFICRALSIVGVPSPS